MEGHTNAAAEGLLGKASTDGELLESLLDGLPALGAAGGLVEEPEPLEPHLRAGRHPGHLHEGIRLPGASRALAGGATLEGAPEPYLDLGRLGGETTGGLRAGRIGGERLGGSALGLVGEDDDALELVRNVVVEKGDIHVLNGPRPSSPARSLEPVVVAAGGGILIALVLLCIPLRCRCGCCSAAAGTVLIWRSRKKKKKKKREKGGGLLNEVIVGTLIAIARLLVLAIFFILFLFIILNILTRFPVVLKNKINSSLLKARIQLESILKW